MGAHASYTSDGITRESQRFRQRELRLEDYFAGPTRAWGMFVDRFGVLRRQLEADIQSTWNGRILTLDETFAYDDGAAERRIWRIEKRGERGYRGHTDDMIGSAEGQVNGNCLQWRYGFKLPVGNKTLAVRFDDRYVLQGDDILLYSAKLRKLGLTIGQLTMAFRKP